MSWMKARVEALVSKKEEQTGYGWVCGGRYHYTATWITEAFVLGNQKAVAKLWKHSVVTEEGMISPSLLDEI
jgi:hypothetical protein